MLSSYRLSRVPQDNLLQAWNAADELVLSRLNPSAQNILLINDTFGVLAVALNGRNVDWWNDSAMSLEALSLNTHTNQMPLPSILENLDLQKKYDAILIHIPKSLRLFQWQLNQISKKLNADTKVYALGMVKHISAGHITAMQHYFNQALPGRAEKKARVIELTEPKSNQLEPMINQYPVPELDRNLINYPGCYAEKTVDPGARVFIKHFSLLPKASRALDLGCGNGILSVALKKYQPEVSIDLVDDSLQAILSAQENLNEFSGCQFIHSNSLNEIDNTNTYDLIICNPPFHQSTTLTENIAHEMIADSAKHLTDDGQLWLVSNRHLDYRQTLRQNNLSFKLISNDIKFNIIQCFKV